MIYKHEDGTYRYHRPDNKPFTLYYKRPNEVVATPVSVDNLLNLTYENKQRWFRVVKIEAAEIILKLLTNGDKVK